MSALLLVSGRVRSDSDFVFGGRPEHPTGSVRHDGERAAPDGTGGTLTQTLTVDLDRVEPAVERIVVVASADGGSFGQVPDLYVRVLDAATGSEIARYDSQDASVETALVLGELYRRQGGWKFRAVGQGFSTGLAGLAKEFGISADQPPARDSVGAPAAPVPPSPAAQAPLPAPQEPAPASEPTAPVRLSKVTLTKDAPRVSLAKQGGSAGALRVNLNWQVRGTTARKGWGARLSSVVQGDLDLDLCALYELSDGRKGVVQALGNAFGSVERPPYIRLDGDDRTGAVETGENLTINLDHKADLKRIVIFVTIYQGASSFAGIEATVTLTPLQGAPIEFALGECTEPSRVCALALITNTGGDLVVQREANYLVTERGVSPQRTIDRAYGWGMNWAPGRK